MQTTSRFYLMLELKTPVSNSEYIISQHIPVLLRLNLEINFYSSVQPRLTAVTTDPCRIRIDLYNWSLANEVSAIIITYKWLRTTFHFCSDFTEVNFAVKLVNRERWMRNVCCVSRKLILSCFLPVEWWRFNHWTAWPSDEFHFRSAFTTEKSLIIWKLRLPDEDCL